MFDFVGLGVLVAGEYLYFGFRVVLDAFQHALCCRPVLCDAEADELAHVVGHGRLFFGERIVPGLFEDVVEELGRHVLSNLFFCLVHLCLELEQLGTVYVC